MPEFTNYTSWNIEKFSKRKAVKSVFRDVKVPYWMATLLLDMGSDMVGVMEVTLGSGDVAVRLLCNALNTVSAKRTGNANWKYYVSARNVSKRSKVARRADRYALLWDSANVQVSGAELAGGKGVAFQDRVPLYWVASAVLSGTKMDCLLWHAPQPKNHQRKATIQKIADLIAAVQHTSGNPGALVSGDFNYNTAKADVYSPLTGAGFDGLFNGERTTLTTLKNFMKDPTKRRKMIAQGDYDEAFLASAYDNIFLRGVTSDFQVKVCVPYVVLEEIKGNIDFQIVTRMQLQQAMKNAKLISDHMPLVLAVSD